MKKVDSNLECPACRHALSPRVLACDECGIKVEGPFQLNEFARLAPDDLHFLRIFIRSEGRIRDMEAALGLSYPTIRNRITALKTKLQGEAGEREPAPLASASDSTQAILERLEKGELGFDEAMALIKKSKSR